MKSSLRKKLGISIKPCAALLVFFLLCSTAYSYQLIYGGSLVGSGIDIQDNYPFSYLANHHDEITIVNTPGVGVSGYGQLSGGNLFNWFGNDFSVIPDPDDPQTGTVQLAFNYSLTHSETTTFDNFTPTPLDVFYDEATLELGDSQLQHVLQSFTLHRANHSLSSTSV